MHPFSLPRNRFLQVGFNDSLASYFYAVMLTALLLFMMEAIMLMVNEQLVWMRAPPCPGMAISIFPYRKQI